MAATNASTQRFEVLLDGELTVHLPDEPGRWVLRFDAPNVWSPEVFVDTRVESEVEIPVWPGGQIAGRVVPPEGSRPEMSDLRLDASFQESERSPSPQGAALAGRSPCELKADRFTCRVPAVQLDLSLGPRGYLTRYFWSLAVPVGRRVNVGTVRLVKGAAVTGFVASREPSFRAAKCELRLVETVADPRLEDTRSTKRRRFRSLSVTPNARGFFHFDGVEPGTYRIEASHPGFAAASTPPMTVEPESETRLVGDLELVLPSRLAVRVVPASDLSGGPWRVEVRRMSEPPGMLDDARPLDLDAEGSGTLTGLDPGRYLVTIFDSRGSSLRRQAVEVAGAAETELEIEFDFVTVTGTVRLGERPLAAKLRFGGRMGAERIELNADEEGRFSGVLPRAGDWRIFVESESPKIEKQLDEVPVEPDSHHRASLELRLHSGSLAGSVIDAGGLPAADATVFLLEVPYPQWTTSDEEGRFVFEGLSPGPVQVTAEKGSLRSDDQVVPVPADGAAPDALLVLRQKKAVRGLIHAGGQPLAGVSILAAPMAGGTYVSASESALSGPSGEFELELPSSADSVDLIALPIGFPLYVAREPVSEDQELRLDVLRSGGDLTLEPEEEPDFGAEVARHDLLLLCDGLLLDLPVLRQWAAMQEAGSDRGQERWRVPALPIGHYALCRLKSFRESLANPSLEPGSPHLSRCVEGDLLAGGALALRAPPAAD